MAEVIQAGYDSLRVDGIDGVVHIESLEIRQKINEHAKLKKCLMLSYEVAQAYIEDSMLHRSIRLQMINGKVLFYGVMTDSELETRGGVSYLNVTAGSFTMMLDWERKNRSWQNQELMRETVLAEILAEYPNSTMLWNEPEGKAAVGQFLLQYLSKESGILLHDYLLVTKGGCRQERIYNDRLKGKLVSGTAIDVARGYTRLHLHMDANQEAAEGETLSDGDGILAVSTGAIDISGKTIGFKGSGGAAQKIGIESAKGDCAAQRRKQILMESGSGEVHMYADELHLESPRNAPKRICPTWMRWDKYWLDMKPIRRICCTIWIRVGIHALILTRQDRHGIFV